MLRLLDRQVCFCWHVAVLFVRGLIWRGGMLLRPCCVKVAELQCALHFRALRSKLVRCAALSCNLSKLLFPL